MGRSLCPATIPLASKNAMTRVPRIWSQAPFLVEPLNFASFTPGDRQSDRVRQADRRAPEGRSGIARALREGLSQVSSIKRIIEQTPSLSPSLRQDARSSSLSSWTCVSDSPVIPRRPVVSSRPPSGCSSRIDTIIPGHWTTTSAPTTSHRQNYEIAAAEFEAALEGFARSLSAICPRCTPLSRPPAPLGTGPQAADLEALSCQICSDSSVLLALPARADCRLMCRALDRANTRLNAS